VVCGALRFLSILILRVFNYLFGMLYMRTLVATAAIPLLGESPHTQLIEWFRGVQMMHPVLNGFDACDGFTTKFRLLGIHQPLDYKFGDRKLKFDSIDQSKAAVCGDLIVASFFRYLEDFPVGLRNAMELRRTNYAQWVTLASDLKQEILNSYDDALDFVFYFAWIKDIPFELSPHRRQIRSSAIAGDRSAKNCRGLRIPGSRAHLWVELRRSSQRQTICIENAIPGVRVHVKVDQGWGFETCLTVLEGVSKAMDGRIPDLLPKSSEEFDERMRDVYPDRLDAPTSVGLNFQAIDVDCGRLVGGFHFLIDLPDGFHKSWKVSAAGRYCKAIRETGQEMDRILKTAAATKLENRMKLML